MKSMDAVRYVPGENDGEDAPLIDNKPMYWKCPHCKKKNFLFTRGLEEYIESEERDPDVEYVKCIHCKSSIGLANKVEAALLNEELPDIDQKGYLESDGYFVYFINEEGRRVRLL